MSELRASKSFYLKAYNLPLNTFKSIAFNRLKYKFPTILITQSVNEENVAKDRCTHHIVIQYESRVIFEIKITIIKIVLIILFLVET